MEALQIVLEDEGVQQMIDENATAINESSETLVQFSDVIKDHIMENLDQFVEPGNLSDTHDNIKVFTEAAVSHFANELSEDLAANN